MELVPPKQAVSRKEMTLPTKLRQIIRLENQQASYQKKRAS
jgi:hypothetical protein|tara:strand:+ start:714 stop:836 length:123 start_codon:yes stop_codon:yes gene_type:complete